MRKDLPLLVGAGLIIWLGALVQWSSQPFFSTPIPDSDVALYWFLSKVIGKYGFTFGDIPVFFSVYYAYLYFLFSLLGNPLKVAVLFNGVLYLTSLVLLFLLLEELFDRETARLGGALFLLTKVMLFYAIVPIKTMLFLSLFILFLLLVVKGRFAVAGVVAGFLSNVEGIFLPLLLLYILLLIVRRRYRGVALVAAGFFLALLPVALLNLSKGRGFSLSSPTSGIHFFIGNQRGATGVYKGVRGVRPNAFGHYYDAKRVAEKEVGRHLSDREVNLFWWKKGIRTVLENPLGSLKLYLKKLLIFFNDYEVPNNYNLYAVSRKVWVVGFLPLSFSLVLSLGAFGYIVARRYGISREVLDLVLFLFPLILSLFFITSRYRVIYYVPLLSYGAVALRYFYRVCSQKDLFRKGLVLSLFALSLSGFPILEGVRAGYFKVFKWKTVSTLDLKRALEKGNYREVRKVFRKAGVGEINRLFRRGWKGLY